MFGAIRHYESVERGHPGRGQVIQRSVDVPAIEPRHAFGLVFGGDAGLVECGVAWVLELGFSKSFVVVDYTIADELDLWDSGDGL